MKKLFAAILLGAVVVSNGIERVAAEDLTDRLQISAIGETAWPFGQHSVTSHSNDAGATFGGMLGYGLSSHWSVAASYENIDLGQGLTVQPVLINGIYRLYSDRNWTPNFILGAGRVRGRDSSFWNFAAKAGVGAEFFIYHSFSIEPQVAYVLAQNQTSDGQYAHMVNAGLVLNMFFGGSHTASDAKATSEAAPAAAAEVVAIAVTPEHASVGPSQNVQLNSAVSGASHSAVKWSISPDLGTISSKGLYTAPATIALAETVEVTATSVEDASKSATSHIKLVPPAEAAKEVDIRMDILFDTNKTVVKPQFDGEIAKVAKFMKTYAHAKAEIDGYTDNTGTSQYNMTLSQKRAESVKNYMIKKFNINPSRLTARGYGETKPIATNDTAAGRAQNRRVVAALTAQEQ